MNASGATAMCGTCVLGPGRHSSRDRGAFGSAMAVLQRRLRTLRQQLAAAEAQQRKEIIEEKLSPKLRQELIWLMETVPAKRPPCNSGREAHGIASWRYKDPARIKANLWTMRTSKGDFFAARMNLCGVVMASRVTRCLREAGRLRQRLEDLGRAAVRLSPHFEGGFRQAVEDAGDLDDLGLNFRLVLDLRPRAVPYNCLRGRPAPPAPSPAVLCQRPQAVAGAAPGVAVVDDPRAAPTLALRTPQPGRSRAAHLHGRSLLPRAPETAPGAQRAAPSSAQRSAAAAGCTSGGGGPAAGGARKEAEEDLRAEKG